MDNYQALCADYRDFRIMRNREWKKACTGHPQDGIAYAYREYIESALSFSLEECEKPGRVNIIY